MVRAVGSSSINRVFVINVEGASIVRGGAHFQGHSVMFYY